MNSELENIKPTEEELKKADEEMKILMLSQGYLVNKEPYYAYLIVNPSNYVALKEAEKKGNYMLKDYGEIVAYGDSYEPPEEVRKEMKEKYDADYDFEQQIAKLVMSQIDQNIPSDKIKKNAIQEILKKKRGE